MVERLWVLALLSRLVWVIVLILRPGGGNLHLVLSKMTLFPDIFGSFFDFNQWFNCFRVYECSAFGCILPLRPVNHHQWQLYKEDNSCKGNNYFFRSHCAKFKQFYIQLKKLGLYNGTYMCTNLRKYTHEPFWMKIHIPINRRKIINIFQIHRLYFFEPDGNKE